MTAAKFVRTATMVLAVAGLIATSNLPAHADETRHGVSLFGSLKYPAGFKHFNYVNPDAPKGGMLRYAALGSFDSLNSYIVTGDAAAGLNLIYDTLLEPSMDEAATEYGLIAEAISYPDDFSSVTFTLRKEARFNDGKPLTADDVIWSFNTLKKINPFYGAYYKNVSKAEILSPDKVRFTFSIKGNRELPLIMGQMPILPKHYWLAKDAKGKPRDITKTTLEAPIGSGPYRIAEVKPGNSITYERVKDYWAKDLAVKTGTNNFDRMRFDYYLDPEVALVAFTGDRADIRLENSAKNWATRYNIPPVKDGRIKLENLRTKNGAGMQGFAFNIRHDLFKDERVRAAFNYAFDFEWANKTLFYGQYTRNDSFFVNSELASSGVPAGDELKLLEPFRSDLPPALFTSPYKNPKTDGSGNNRGNLAEAGKLLDTAGWKVTNGKRLNAKGVQMSVEFLLDNPTFERVVAPYRQALERLGVKSTIRTVDSAQYQTRVDQRDFDIIVQSFGQSLSPGNEQRDFWGCDAAKRPGSRNVIGICDPAVEALIDKVIFAKSRQDLVTATRALDRVLLWEHYVVPNWYSPFERVAYWARLGHPEPTPDYSIGFPHTWWYTADAKGSAK
ncbi:MAG: extracellular solute-binding protein [Parvibaculaceae bacterium]